MKLLDKKELRHNLMIIMDKENATKEETFTAMEEYFNAISLEKAEQVRAEYEELKNVTDNEVLAARGIYTLTAEETKYYNEVQKTGKFPEEDILPETIIEKVFEDLQKERPLLKVINFIPSIGRTKVITSKRLGKAVWGPVHRDLEGQLDFTFDASETTLKSLTAFFLISNDTLDLGPRWIDRYVRLCLQEAVAEAWEEGIVTGDGSLGPIGLTKDLDGAVVGGKYPDKASSGTLTFSPKTIVSELTGMLSKLSKYEVKYTDATGAEQTETKYRNVNGKVQLIVNPYDYYSIVNATTTLNAMGQFITVMPFISPDKIITSEFVPEGKVIVALENGYQAQAAYSNRIYVYPQTFAMKRATLYAIDVFGDGKPIDNTTALVYDFKPETETETVVGP